MKFQAELASGSLNPFHCEFLGIWERGRRTPGGSAGALLTVTHSGTAYVCPFFPGEKGGK